ELIWAILLGLGGIAFLTVFITDRQHWWALIPGCTLVGVSITLFLEYFWPQAGSVTSGLIILGSIALAFLIIYLLNWENWWALIPAGVLFTLAVVAVLDEVYPQMDTGSVFFVGLGLTFAALAILPNPIGQMRWAFIPAVVLILIGIVLAAVQFPVLSVVFALALIVVGVFFLFRAFQWRRE
ncbi:MAG: hypothetical protein MUP90_18565, partial [Gammaproteobacteria bacterium]|nr:hypothetical protein [Gammaproteobacteria bacterium]